MPFLRDRCKHPGCGKPQKPIGLRYRSRGKEYDKEGFLVRRRRGRETYYSSYCDRHRMTYNRG